MERAIEILERRIAELRDLKDQYSQDLLNEKLTPNIYDKVNRDINNRIGALQAASIEMQAELLASKKKSDE